MTRLPLVLVLAACGAASDGETADHVGHYRDYWPACDDMENGFTVPDLDRSVWQVELCSVYDHASCEQQTSSMVVYIRNDTTMIVSGACGSFSLDFDWHIRVMTGD